MNCAALRPEVACESHPPPGRVEVSGDVEHPWPSKYPLASPVPARQYASSMLVALPAGMIITSEPSDGIGVYKFLSEGFVGYFASVIQMFSVSSSRLNMIPSRTIAGPNIR